MLSPKILVIFMENLKENRQVWSGVAIFISVVIALVWANSPWQEIYHSLIHTEIAVQIWYPPRVGCFRC